MSIPRSTGIIVGLLLAVWLSITAYRTNPTVRMPHIFESHMAIVPCYSPLPAQLQVKRWVPGVCWQSVYANDVP